MAQDACVLPAGLTKPAVGNLFSEEQENWLGDAIADLIEHHETLVKDAAENAYLARIGERLLAALPPTHIKFRFLLIDSGEINGFSLAGGRVYITRKLVSNARSEDEVAGVLAHEIGHIVTHQSAVEVSDRMRRLLKITQVGDRADIYEKFTRMMDIPDNKHYDPDSDENQAIADSVALYAMAKAGYALSSYPEFWDRSFFVQGKTGSGWSDFFGMTKPTQKRLRSLRAMVAAFPKGCGAASATVSVDFSKWQKLVTANQKTDGEESPSIAVTLTPALRMDLNRLRYSPDGTYLMAQDESSIFVLSSTSRKLLFQFDADEAYPAQWSPDSKRIVFHTPKLHIEEWDVEQKTLRTAREMVIQSDCMQTSLSPDGRTLICIATGDFVQVSGLVPLDLLLFDTESSQQVFQKKSFSRATAYGVFLLYMRSFSNIAPLSLTYSQDGNTVLLGDVNGKIAFDLKTRTEIKLGGDLRGDVSGPFAFQGDGVVAINMNNTKNSGLFSFPDGRPISKVNLNAGVLSSVSRGDVVRALGTEGDSLVLNLKNQKVLLKVKSQVLDLWGESIAAQGLDGAVDMGTMKPDGGPTQLNAREKLPLSPLGTLRVMELSPDGRYLAISGKSRGGVWDAATGKRIYSLRGFSGAAFHSDGNLYLDFPKYEKTERKLVKLTLDGSSVTDSTVAVTDDMRVQAGRILEWKSEKNNSTLNVQDVASGKLAWSRSFDKNSPASRTNLADGNVLLIWNTDSAGGKAELKLHPELAMEASALKDKSKGLVLELLDAQDGKLRQSVVLEKPRAYDGPAWVHMIGDVVLIETDDYRTQMYSAKTGALMKQMFGYVVAADSENGLFCMKNRRNEAIVYDLSGTEKTHVSVNANIRFARLRDKGKKLLVLGADQKLRSFDLAIAR